MDFSIKGAARVVGLTLYTLRYYGSISLLPETERTSGDYHLFNVTDIIDLIRVKRLTGFGFDLRHMRQIMGDPTSSEATAALDAQRQILIQQIDELREKRAKIEKTQNAQALLDVIIKLADLERAWADAQSRPDVEDRLKLGIELLAAFADDPNRFKYEKLTRVSIGKYNDPGFRELQELDTRLEVSEPDVSPEEIAILVDDYVRVLGPIRTRFAPASEKAFALISAMEEFTYDEAQFTVIINAWKHLRSSDGESPDPS